MVERNLAKVDVAGSSPVSRSNKRTRPAASRRDFRLAPYRTRLRRARVVRDMFIVYVLKSLKDGKRYIGYTKDIDRRLKEHNSGKTTSTKLRRPFIVIYTEKFSSKKEAEVREIYFKSGKGREELNKILTGAVPKW